MHLKREKGGVMVDSHILRYSSRGGDAPDSMASVTSARSSCVTPINTESGAMACQDTTGQQFTKPAALPSGPGKQLIFSFSDKPHGIQISSYDTNNFQMPPNTLPLITPTHTKNPTKLSSGVK